MHPCPWEVKASSNHTQQNHAFTDYLFVTHRVRAVGSVLHLRQRYGSGYRISAIVKPEASDDIKKGVKKIIPHVRIESESAGNIVFNITATESNLVAEVLRLMEKNSGADGAVKDWGLTQTTLDEIFLRVVHGTQDDSDSKGYSDAEEFQINVVLQGSNDPIGFIRSVSTETLSETREKIVQVIEGAPKKFHFLWNKAPISKAQERTTYAVDLAPIIVLRPDEDESDDEDDSGDGKDERKQKGEKEKEIKELKAKLKKSEAEKDEAEKKLEGMLKTQDEMRKQLKALQEQIRLLSEEK